ncbi:hypothetical protein GCM10023149_25290 [Mucilaginibacter gynuensis]|uniref:Uncharacterized protein n=2 Tax=Mucilaginibacter gynuensis TaxID=1302236 RepID=A0ABP8GHB2_9SPHI
MRERKEISSLMRQMNYDFTHVFAEPAANYYMDLKYIHRNYAFELVISDNLFSGVPFIKAKMKLPVIIVGMTPLSQSSADTYHFGYGLQPGRSAGGKLKQYIWNYLLTRFTLRRAQQVYCQQLYDHGVAYNGHTILDVITRYADVYLQQGTAAFEYERTDLGKNVRFIGRLPQIDDHTELNQATVNKLAHFQQVLLISGDVSTDKFRAVINAFDHTDTLLVFCCDEVEHQFLITQQPHARDNVIFTSRSDMAALMPFCTAFLTNGEYEGVMQAIVSALPIVAAGLREGRNEVCARIRHFGVGIDLQTETPSATSIRRAFRAMVTDPRYKVRVSALSEKLHSIEPGAVILQTIFDLLNNHGPTDVPAASLNN